MTHEESILQQPDDKESKTPATNMLKECWKTSNYKTWSNIVNCS